MCDFIFITLTYIFFRSFQDVHNCQYISCMNPTAGSFTINPRLQVVINCWMYGSIKEMSNGTDQIEKNNVILSDLNFYVMYLRQYHLYQMFFFLQKHFSVFAISFPGPDALATVFSSILSQHLYYFGFPTPVQVWNKCLGGMILHFWFEPL